MTLRKLIDNFPKEMISELFPEFLVLQISRKFLRRCAANLSVMERDLIFNLKHMDELLITLSTLFLPNINYTN